MPETQLTLTAEESQFLTGLLEVALRDVRVEEHRTRVPAFREHILHREAVMARLLAKLGEPEA
jgi:hypothetical protein